MTQGTRGVVGRGSGKSDRDQVLALNGMGEAALRPGDSIGGRYRVLRHLGTGGMGQVFAAERLALGDEVAIKCISPDRDTPKSRARFLREARAMARIRHPNVVQVFDFGEEAGLPCLVMELLQGPTLAEVLKHRRLTPAEAGHVFAQVCSAVEAGHRRGVVHRDLKPGNVVLATGDAGGQIVKVLDFGLARFVGDEGNDGSQLSTAGGLMGTVAYMSPEQVEAAAAGTASDIWALGVMLYEMLTGELPFRAPTPVATLMKILDGEFTPVAQLVSGVPDAFEEAIAAALQSDPGDRPDSPMDLARRVADPESVSLGAGESFINAPVVLAATTAAGDTTAPSVAVETLEPEELLVGRDEELEALLAELEEARVGDPRISVLLGEPGAGKTTLLEAFRRRAQQAGAAVFSGRFFAYEGDRPPPNETFLWMLHGSSTDGAGGRPLGGGTQTIDAQEEEGGRWRASEEIANKFAMRARGQTIVLLLDDVHWATGLELDFLSYLLRPVADRRVHVVVTADVQQSQPNAKTELSSWLLRLARHHPRSRTSIALPAFDESDLREWLTRRFGRVRVRPRAVRRLIARTGGNPHYLDEVLRHLSAQGHLKREEHAWALELGDEDPLPDGISQALLGHVQDLDSDVRTALEAAAVIGEEIRFETLQQATGIDEEDLEERLEHAIDAGLFTDRGTSAGADFRFVSPTLRAVLYDSLSRRRRRKLHRKVVDALCHLYARDQKRIAKVLCVHFHATGDWDATVRWGLEAAQALLASHDVDNAEASLARAREAARHLREEGAALDAAISARIARLAGTIAARLGRGEEAVGLLVDAVRQSRHLGDEELLLEAELELAQAELGRGEIRRALEVADHALEIATRVDDVPRQWRARILAGEFLARMGEYAAAAERIGPVLAPGAEGPDGLRAGALRVLGWLESRRGNFVAASKHAEEVLALARRTQDPMAEYYGTSLRALALGERGEGAASLPLYEEALRMTRALSLRRREMIETANMAMSLLSLGRLDEALSCMLQTRALCVELEDRASEGDSCVGLAQVLLARGEVSEAIKQLERGRILCDQAGRVEYAALATLELGEAELGLDNFDAAQSWFADAHARLQKVESHFVWRAHFGLARCLDHRGSAREQALVHARTARSGLDAHLSQSEQPEPALTRSSAEIDELIARLSA